MKKFFSLILAAMLAVSLAACTGNTETSSNKESSATAETSASAADNNALVGGYTDTESPKVTDEIKTLVQKATADLDGAEYTPVAYVASQVVAGTNHMILCKMTPVVQNPVTTYAMVTIYEDLQGNAELTDVIKSSAIVHKENNLSSVKIDWTENESLEVSDEAKTALDKATSTITGAEYKPVAMLSSAIWDYGNNVVEGKEYYLLCKASPTVPNALPYYALLDVFYDIDNPENTKVLDTYEFIKDDTAQDETAQDSAASMASTGNN